MKPLPDPTHGFVADGCERGRAAMREEIARLRTQFVAENFGERFAAAGPREKLEMERAAAQAVEEKVGSVEKTFPKDALY